MVELNTDDQIISGSSSRPINYSGSILRQMHAVHIITTYLFNYVQNHPPSISRSPMWHLLYKFCG
jgi:hypothetical protein